jgi:folate-binding protein YgfZ
VVNAKGRIEAEIYIHVSEDGNALLLDADRGLRESIAQRLERYIVADDVTLEDVTEEWNLLHSFAGTNGVGELPGIASSRLGVPGTDLWRPGGHLAQPPGREPVDGDEFETLRICRGIPGWPHELNPDAFPQEAGLETQVMDFAKGCYIGQEVLSRIKTTGKMPRRLVRFTVDRASPPAERGMKLMTREGASAGKEAGEVTSATWHPQLDQWVGLAYVRQAFEAADSLLLASGDPPRILGDVKITWS